MKNKQEKPEVKIKDWRFFEGALRGTAINHPRFDPDTPVRTSTILKRPMNPKDGDRVETLNTIYVLVGDGVK